MDYSKYGLTKTNASSSDLDKGIVQAPDGSFYKIDGFQHGQEDGLDQDKGKVFSSSLEADGRAAGFDPSSFNTAGDVQNALNALGGGGEEEAPQVFGISYNEAKFSPQVQGAIERVAAYRDRAWSGQNAQDVFGKSKTLANGVTAEASSTGTDKAGEAADLATRETYFDAEKYKRDYGEEYKASNEM